MHTKIKRNPIVALLGSKKKTQKIVFLIFEGSNRECCDGNKMFDILEFLSFCFVSVPTFT